MTGQEVVVADDYCRGMPIPWWAKLGAKLVLARLPVSNDAWNRLGIFRHSFGEGLAPVVLDRPAASVARFVELRGRPPRSVLELGPGRMTTRALGWAAAGVERIWFLDVDDFGPREVEPYLAHLPAVLEKRPDLADLAGIRTREALFERLGVTYLTGGTPDLARLPAEAVDLAVSEAVVEHVLKHELAAWFAGQHRAMAPDGLGFHGVDLHDHLGGGLNSLRFSDRVWESALFRNSGFYTNRVPERVVAEIARAAGFEVEVEQRGRWAAARVDAGGVHRDLPHLPDDLRTAFAMLRVSPEKSPARTGVGHACAADRAAK